MIITLSQIREHLAAESLGAADDELLQGYLDSAKQWAMTFLNLDALPNATGPNSKIIRQAILLTVGQYFLQREEVVPNFHRTSHLTAERLLNGIRTRQLGD